MAKETKGEYKEFRDLLRRGIGTKTQKAFANEINISKEYLNRILNNREISRPSIGLIKRMSSHMQSVTERMLLESCGYDVEPIEERTKRCENQIKKGLCELTDMEHGRLWRSAEDAVQTVGLHYAEENGEINLGKEEPCTEEGHRWAEKKLHFDYSWSDGENNCAIGAEIYYSRTENGNLIFLDYRVEETEIQSMKTVAIHEMEERLLKAIYGVDKEEKVMTTAFGYGFYFTETPSGFTDFLYKHQGTFCTNRERSRMLLSMIDDGMDSNQVFEDFETEKYGGGTGGAVAEVLSRESGMYFYHCQVILGSNEDCTPACIMVEDEEYARSGVNKTKLLLYLRDAAELLHIPQFGHIYYSFPTSPQVKLYDTNTFGYEFRDPDHKISERSKQS